MTVVPHSPLAHRHDELRAASGRSEGAVTLTELPSLAQLDLRADDDARTLLGEAAAIALPTQPNRWTAGDPGAYWLAPDEWLLVGAPGEQHALEADVRSALGDAWFTLVDVSDQRTVLELSGPAARDVLAAGCPLDLHARAFGPGACAQTLIARAGALIALHDEAPTFRLFVRASFAGYVADWLIDAMAQPWA